ncbi:4172_t:CDS:2, partial [Scutellospora calospora]
QEEIIEENIEKGHYARNCLSERRHTREQKVQLYQSNNNRQRDVSYVGTEEYDEETIYIAQKSRSQLYTKDRREVKQKQFESRKEHALRSKIDELENEEDETETFLSDELVNDQDEDLCYNSWENEIRMNPTTYLAEVLVIKEDDLKPEFNIGQGLTDSQQDNA